ncbi:hypothetical protein HOD05_05435 [Candidatus Woesearchaeota archaeon]|jgi:hypothetical protein|nr:hypothetical protein [Candidatus Woesearchaeota archaeon]MBT4150508.1 hypothetical protein [Candidatus Woesearchaeota archaeon]MBT4247148.1 hypothetical protein [Candidatus Woesearchaeota archaeon]MBT4434626.1 hypothetical protein [Candidatus Woesearchaeota archaeon]MBT7332522.1 hypothetical protein [Candidatus Woesearchaeota archaeon]
MKKLDLSKVEYSNNDKRLGIKVPEFLTEELAYFLGFHVGDGYMKLKIRKNKWDYHLLYGGHQINEYQWYIEFIKPLINNLFNKKVNITKSTKNIVKIEIRSKAILTFLHNSCDISFSPKTNIRIPKPILNSNMKIKRAFLRGIADTDFSLVFKKGGKYPVISHATNSKTLHDSLKELLIEMDFNIFSATYNRIRIDKPFVSHQIEINGKKNLSKWIEEVGYSSYNSITRYRVWKEYGYLPKGTNINDRLELLKVRGINPLVSAPDRI